MLEMWKEVPEYEGLYEVSNLGRVRSLDRITNQYNNGSLSVTRYKGKLLKGRADNKGYVRIHVSKNGKSEELSLHRLVALVFCSRPDDCDIVNHLDNDPSNNRADNLEWTTYKGNMQWATCQGRMHYNPENLRKAQESKKIPVIAIDSNGRELYFSSQTEAATVLNISRGHIAAACRNDYGYKTVGGFKWRYADDQLQTNAIINKRRSKQ